MIEKPILDVLRRLQQHGNTYIIGGYLRDKILDIKPKDIDLVTAIPFHELEKLIPSLYSTEQGKEIGVGKFQKSGFSFEISSISNPIEEEILKKDYTINSLYHDGNELYIAEEAKKDLENRIIRPLDDFVSHCKERPQAYLRAIRIASKINGKIDSSLLYLMKGNLDIFFENNANRIRQEGYEILDSFYPQIGLNILHDLGFLKQSISLSSEQLHFDTQDKAYKLAFLSLHSTTEMIEEFARLFDFKHSYIDEMHEILALDSVDIKNANPRTLSRVIKWNRYKYQLEPDKLSAFLLQLKNHLS